jgi:hypothetical protein
MAMIDKLSDPVILFALVLAFVLGFMMRGSGRGSLSPAPMNRDEIDAAFKRVTISRWMDIDAEIAAGRKLAAIKLLREATGLGLKDSKEAIEARERKRDLRLH